MRLNERVAIVTGAGDGIGKAIAMGLAAEGAALVVNDVDPALAAATARQISNTGGRAMPFPADVADLDQHDAIVATALTGFGRLDILVNNAGIQFRGAFLESTPESWDRSFAVNLRGPYFLAQKAVKAMVEAGRGGKILNIASVHDTIPLCDRSIYSITKGGMKLLTLSLALELAQYRINVNSISPGAIATEMNRLILSDPNRLAAVLAKIPWNRMGEPADLVGAAIFLVSPEADYITGVTLYVDGGLLLL